MRTLYIAKPLYKNTNKQPNAAKPQGIRETMQNDKREQHCLTHVAAEAQNLDQNIGKSAHAPQGY